MLDLLIDAAAVHRLTRLVTRDTFPPVRAIREAFHAKFPPENAVIADADPEWDVLGADDPDSLPQPGDRVTAVSIYGIAVQGVAITGPGGELAVAVTKPHPIGELLACTWCASVWVAFGVVAARRAFPRAWAPVATALALSSAAALTTDRVG